jgi:hypothetical protein
MHTRTHVKAVTGIQLQVQFFGTAYAIVVVGVDDDDDDGGGCCTD